MTRSTTDGDEIMYMNEINDEVSRPLTSTDVDAVSSNRLPSAPPVGFTIDTENENGSQPSSRPEIHNNVDGKPANNSKGGNNERATSKSSFSLRNFMSSNPFSSPEPSDGLTPDVNVYQHKKTIAQGMMDLALLSANANQMRYVLQTDGQHPYFYPALSMISMSLFLQIAVGIGLIWNSRYNVKEHLQMCKANKANNWTVIGIFLVTILNVFISSFGVVDQVQTSAVAT